MIHLRPAGGPLTCELPPDGWVGKLSLENCKSIAWLSHLGDLEGGNGPPLPMPRTLPQLMGPSQSPPLALFPVLALLTGSPLFYLMRKWGRQGPRGSQRGNPVG